MSPTMLKRLGEAVWGHCWSFKLSRAIVRSPVTVRRWQSKGKAHTKMSQADMLEVLRQCMRHSKERHKAVRLMIAGIKSQENQRAYRPPVKPREKSVRQHYRKLAKGI